MKYLSLPLLLSFLLVAGCMSAARTTESGETANVIYIETEDDAETAYRKVGRILSEQGLVVAESDPTLGTITTEEDQYARVTVAILEGEPTRIQLMGRARLPGFPEQRVSSYGASDSPARRAWDRMERVAEAYEGGTIRYERTQ